MSKSGVVPISQSAYVALRNAIVELAIEPGSFLLDKDVADIVGASRTPVREALAQLEVEGWIESVPRKGFRVIPVDLREIAEVSELLAAVEALGASALAEERNSLQISVLKESNSQLREVAESGDVSRFLNLDDRFHRLIAADSLSRRLTGSIYAILLDQLHRARKLMPIDNDQMLEHVEEHCLLIMAIELGNKAAADLICKEHRRKIKDRLSGPCSYETLEPGKSRLSEVLELESTRAAGSVSRTREGDERPGDRTRTRGRVRLPRLRTRDEK